MIVLKGKYNTAIVFSDKLETFAREQIERLLDQPFVTGSKIRIMPDVHAGAGCTIGTTMTIQDKVVPNLVGVDIGCGMLTARLAEQKLDLELLDKTIHRRIPAGFAVRKTAHRLLDETDLFNLKARDAVNLDRARLSIGTLGGGNHFIELARAEDRTLYLVVHSGSRNAGKQIAEFYQKEAARRLAGQGIDKSLAYCQGGLMQDYLNDMAIMQRFAETNRRAIMAEIVQAMGLTVREEWTTIHNYIDMSSLILRKGAVSSQKGEKILIPLNMRDGSLICLGKGNPDWNYSAPHGAGRLMSRRAAKRSISLAAFKESMRGIHSSTISHRTLDEAAMAYKDAQDIILHIGPTAEILDWIKPIYNFKAAE